MDSKNLSFVMAKRLKDLRKSKKLSHASLCKELKDKYGISISRDILMQYEVETEHHSKKFANNGMRVETLRYIADYYNVSTDYLLGISDTPTSDPNIKATEKLTGLNHESINVLKNWNNSNHKQSRKEYNLIMNEMITSSYFEDFLDDIYHFLLLNRWGNQNEQQEIRHIVKQNQEAAMDYLEGNRKSNLITAFVAMKSNLNHKDIAQFYLKRALDYIEHTVVNIDLQQI